MSEFVYFTQTNDSNFIRIGYTGAGQRVEDHESYGHKLLAKIPATVVNEKSLHNHFEAHRASCFGTSKSHYYAGAVAPYVNALLSRGAAISDKERAATLPRLPWSEWSPEAMSRPLIHNGQYVIFRTEAMEADVRDTWQTPKQVADLCRAALGGIIDLDPASSAAANLIINASYFFTEDVNGLSLPWRGRIFLNPPYGGNEEVGAKAFTRKLVSEIQDGHVEQAITVLNLQSWPTLWFPIVKKHASAHAVWRKRIPFLGPRPKSGKGTKYGSSKNGTIFSYFGREHKRFEDLFEPFADTFELRRVK